MERWECMLHYRRRTRVWYICFCGWRASARVRKKAAAARSRVEFRTLRHFFMLLRSVSISLSSKRLRLIRTQRLGDHYQRQMVLTEWSRFTKRKRSVELRFQRQREKALRCKACQAFRSWQQFLHAAAWLRTTALSLELILRPSWIRAAFWIKWVSATEQAGRVRTRAAKANALLRRIFRSNLAHRFRVWSEWLRKQQLAASAVACSMLRRWHGLSVEKASRRFAKITAQVLAWKGMRCLVKTFRSWKQSVDLSLRFRRLSGKVVFKVGLSYACVTSPTNKHRDF